MRFKQAFSCDADIGDWVEQAFDPAYVMIRTSGHRKPPLGVQPPVAPLGHAPCGAAEVRLIVISVTRLSRQTNVR